jgi:molybdenum cofactor cytidylyltransferase
METSAVLLSGGVSSRFGGGPKALASAGDRSVIRRMAEVCLDRGYDPVVAVAGPHAAPIARELHGLRVELIDSARWFEGRTASIQTGLLALPPARDVLLWPVDHPFADARTLDLLESARTYDALGVWFIPEYQGRGGHPVLFRDLVRAKVLELRGDAPLRSLLPELGPQVLRIEVDDPGVVDDIDTLDSYRAALDGWRARGGS